MLAHDISRDSFQRSKNYSGIRQQQGRIPLDSEINESYDIIADELRRAIKDVICCCGTPDDGFKIELNPPEAGAGVDLNFSIAAGTYYMGGERYDNLTASTYLAQNDWVQPPPDITLPIWETGEEHKFVWLEGWEQNITAIEDNECFEKALGGPDGAGRRRRMARIHVFDNASDNCASAMAEAMAENYPGATVDHDECLVISDAKLTIDFTETGPSEDLCAPQTQGGYLGADNETFRIQITAPGRFIYGRDNASATYRIEVDTIDGDPNPKRRIVFQNLPKDSYAQPLAGQAIEIFRSNTELPNGEKIAEPLGKLFTIESDYDPDTGTMIISAELPGFWDDAYFYARIWTGGSGDATQPDHAIPAGAETLGNTGLTAQFVGSGLVGDHWIVAARPNAPNVVTPWKLLDQAPPMGPVRRVAPLALISRPINAANEGEVRVTDCRERFRKLCKIGGCCTVTVGDGVKSHGDTNSIQDAISRLPDSGGEICLLPGVFVENVRLINRDNIVFKGCGARTIWLAESMADVDPADLAMQAALYLEGCENITLNHFTMSAKDFECVRVGPFLDDNPEGPKGGWCDNLKIDDIDFQATDRSALWINGCRNFNLVNSIVSADQMDTARSEESIIGTLPAVFVLGTGIHIEHNQIVGAHQAEVSVRPVAGIQIGGGSEDIVIRDNVILGGAGNGITLGHLKLESEDEIVNGGWSIGIIWTIGPDGCFKPGRVFIPGDDSVITVTYPVSAGAIENIDIDGNKIMDMGGSGISVALYFDLNSDNPDYIAVENLTIRNNHIEGCLSNEFPEIDFEQIVFKAHAVIALAACDELKVIGNKICKNAKDVLAQNCGLFVIYGSSLVFRENQIYANGKVAQEAANQSFGRRGGIVVGYSSTSAVSNNLKRDSDSREKNRQFIARHPALICEANFIDSTHGPALKVLAFGPVHISDNKLNGAGYPYLNFGAYMFGIATNPTAINILAVIGALLALFSKPAEPGDENLQSLAELFFAMMGGHAVSVVNLGIMEEIPGLFSFFGDSSDQLQAFSVGGETALSNNQISLYSTDPSFSFYTSAVLAISYDDVMISDNQIECENSLGAVAVNTFAIGMTTRVVGNRFQERYLPPLRFENNFSLPTLTLVSAWTYGLVLNTTAANQGTHCFFASTPEIFREVGLVDEANTSIMDAAAHAVNVHLEFGNFELRGCDGELENLKGGFGNSRSVTLGGLVGLSALGGLANG